MGRAGFIVGRPSWCLLSRRHTQTLQKHTLSLSLSLLSFLSCFLPCLLLPHSHATVSGHATLAKRVKPQAASEVARQAVAQATDQATSRTALTLEAAVTPALSQATAQAKSTQPTTQAAQEAASQTAAVGMTDGSLAADTTAPAQGTPEANPQGSVRWLAQAVAGADELWSSDEEDPLAKCTSGRRAAEDFIQSWVASPGPETCGHWQTKFAKLHDDMRLGRGTRRYITFENPHNMPKGYPRPGLGDYLVGMATTFVLGLLTNRSFIMQPSPFTEVVDPGTIDWRPKGHVPMFYGSRVTPVVYLKFFNTRRNEGGWRNAVTVPTKAIKFFAPMAGAANVRVATNGGILARTFANRSSEEYRTLHALGLRLPTAFGCILRFLFRPKAEIWGAILPQLEAMLRPLQSVVGIHMRTSDEFAWAQGGNESAALALVLRKTEATVLQCARDMADMSSPDGYKPAWLFLSDSATLRARVQEEYKDKIIPNDIDPVHPSFTGTGFMAPVFAEWLLFSTSRSFVITESGFSKTSAAYNIQSPKIFLFSHFQDNVTGSCEPSRPSSLLHFTRWSGL